MPEESPGITQDIGAHRRHLKVLQRDLGRVAGVVKLDAHMANECVDRVLTLSREGETGDDRLDAKADLQGGGVGIHRQDESPA